MANASHPSSSQAAAIAVSQRINNRLSSDLLLALSITVGAFSVYRILRSLQRRARLIGCLSREALSYFSKCPRWWARIQHLLLYAPFPSSKYTSSTTLGNVPTRFQALFLLATILGNAFLCFGEVPYSSPEAQVLAVLRARCGTIAATNLIPVMIMSSIKNPLVDLLDISYDSWNFMHRCFGCIAIIEAALHSTFHIASALRQSGLASLARSFSQPQIWTGVVTMACLLVILLQLPSIVRRTFYEAFLYAHICLVAVFLGSLWKHVEFFPQHQRITLGCIILWATSRLLRVGTLLYRSVGGDTACTATIQCLSCGIVRIDIITPRPWTYKPGQHAYITIPGIGLFTAHPFSVAWTGPKRIKLVRQHSQTSDHSNHDMEKATKPIGPPILSFIVRVREGFTKKLAEHAMRQAPAYVNRPVRIAALMEGPYGICRSLDSYGTVLLLAGGVGITYHLGYVRHLIQGHADEIVATRRLTLIWVVRRESDKEWVREWMNEILQMEGRRAMLRLEIWVTRGMVFECESASNSVLLRRGRPNVEEIVRGESKMRLGCLGVSVCGPRGLHVDARQAVRQSIWEGRNVEYMEAAYGW